mgnify:CR=1 FL=1
MKGTVYRLDCVETGDIYIGSTVSMKNRKSAGWSNQLPETFVPGEPQIIEEWEGETIRELRMREQYYIDKYPCVNRCRAYMTDDQKREARLAEYHRNKGTRRANERRKEKRFNCEFCDVNMRWDYRHLHWRISTRCYNARKKKEADDLLAKELAFTKGRNKSIYSSEYNQETCASGPTKQNQVVLV